MLDYQRVRVAVPSDLRPPEADLAPDGGDCARCGYALLGVQDDEACPECGLLAERSRCLDGHLTDVPPRWLRGIGAGIWLVVAAQLVALAWPEALRAILARWPPTFRVTGMGQLLLDFPVFGGVTISQELASLSGHTAAAALLLAGVWLLTRRQPGGPGDAALRWSLRGFAALPIALLTGYYYLAVANPWLTPIGALFDLTAIWSAVRFLLVLGCAPIPALLFALLRRLAVRLLRPGLAEHALIVGVGLSATLVAVPPFALANAADPTWWARSNIAMALTIAMWVAAILFAGWGLLNCVRFALAFGQAYRAARRKWRDADRAADAR